MKTIKRKPGQPKKADAKVNITFRVHPDVAAIIKAQPNQVVFIEGLVRSSAASR